MDFTDEQLSVLDFVKEGFDNSQLNLEIDEGKLI